MPTDCFIADGYTLTKRLDAAPGLHPAVTVGYRPALAVERTKLGFVAGTTPEKVAAAENELIERQRVTLDNEPVKAAQAARLVPALREKVLHLVLGYAGGDEDEGDRKNSCAASA